MPPLQPTIAIEKSLKRPSAPVTPVRLSMIDATEARRFLPGKILGQAEGPDRLRRHEGALASPSVQSGFDLRWFALALVGSVCATMIGFVSEIRPLKAESPDYGYDEALGTQSASMSSSSAPSCSDDCRVAVGMSDDGSKRLGASPITAEAAGTDHKPHLKEIGGDLAE